MPKHETHLICHTNKSGNNVAQAKIQAKNGVEAREQFKESYPGREIVSQGILGKS